MLLKEHTKTIFCLAVESGYRQRFYKQAIRHSVWKPIPCYYSCLERGSSGALLRSAMERRRIAVLDSLDEMSRQIRSLCCSSIRHWSDLKADERFDVEPLSGGLTNKLYRCWTEDGFTVVVRIFGDHSDYVISRQAEGESGRMLAERGFGKQVLAEFDNGRIEEWISGRAITVEEMRDSRISRGIAHRLALLHQQVIESKIFDRSRPGLWNTMKYYARKAAEVRFDDSSKQSQLLSIDIPKQLKQLALTKTFLTVMHPSPIVFCHNDLLCGNIVMDDTEAAKHFIQFIDFEYAFYNHRAFDIANHFCELCGLDCDWSLFPTPEFQHAFARNYLTQLNGCEATDQETDGLVLEVLPWTLACHLFWGFWAVIQSSTSTIDFDYLDYAQKRFAGFDYFSGRVMNGTAERNGAI